MFQNNSEAGEWQTVPISRPSGVQRISDVQVVEFEIWAAKFIKTLGLRYEKAQYKEEVLNFISMLTNEPQSSLCELNIKAITLLCKLMGLKNDNFVRSSGVETQLSGTGRLVELTKHYGAQIYLCGGGATEYFEEKLFFDENLEVEMQKFSLYLYSQKKSGNFIPGLSIIDLIMNVGFKHAGTIILSKK